MPVVITDRTAKTPSRATITGSVSNGVREGVGDVFDLYAKRTLKDIEENGYFVRVAAGKEFYVYVLEAVDPQKAALRIKGNAVLDGATLKLVFDGGAPVTGTRLDVISANGLTGTFATIDAGNVKVRPVYTGSALSVVVE